MTAGQAAVVQQAIGVPGKAGPIAHAHEEASKIEHHTRHHPEELHDALFKEGWEAG